MARLSGWVGVAALAAYPLLVAGGFVLHTRGELPTPLLLVLLAWPFLPAALGAGALLGSRESTLPRWWLPGAIAAVGAALELIAGPLVYVLLVGAASP